MLGGRLIGRGHDRAEIGEEALRVVAGQALYAGGGGRLDENAGVVMLVEPEDDLGIAVGGGIGLALPSEADYAAGIIVADLRKRIGLAEDGGGLESRPFDPRVEPVANWTTSAIYAPPTRAAVSRK